MRIYRVVLLAAALALVAGCSAATSDKSPTSADSTGSTSSAPPQTSSSEQSQAPSSSTETSDSSSAVEEMSSAYIDHVREVGTLRIGYIANPPFINKDIKTGEWSGPHVELGQYLADQIGVPLTIVEATSPEANVAGMQAGRWDMVADVGNTPQRQEAVHFTVQLYNKPTALMVNTAYSDATTWDEATAKGKVVCVGPSVKFVQMLKDLKIEADIQELPAQSDCFAALASGRVDATYWNWESAGDQCHEHDNIRVLVSDIDPLADGTPGSYWGVPVEYSDADLAPINKYIDDFMANHWADAVDKIRDSIRDPRDCIPDGQVPGWIEEASNQMFGTS